MAKRKNHRPTIGPTTWYQKNTETYSLKRDSARLVSQDSEGDSKSLYIEAYKFLAEEELYKRLNKENLEEVLEELKYLKSLDYIPGYDDMVSTVEAIQAS